MVRSTIDFFSSKMKMFYIHYMHPANKKDMPRSKIIKKSGFYFGFLI